jgi:hypothetical protein
VAEQPILHAPRPALRIGNFETAIDHYVAWLGFNLDWEWREAPGQPAIGFLSRDHFAFMINEYPDAPGPAALRDAVGPPLGVAIEVLNEHPDYARAFSARQTEADDGNAP